MSSQNDIVLNKAIAALGGFVKVLRGKLKAAELLLAKGESDSKAMHQNRTQAKLGLQQLLTETASWYGKQLSAFPNSAAFSSKNVLTGGSAVDPSTAAGTIVLYVGSLAVCRTLLLLGRALSESMETIEGYLHTEAAVDRLDLMQGSGKPLPAEKVPLNGKFTPNRRTAGTPKMLKGSRVSLIGSALLAEGFVAMAMANQQWGDPDSAMTVLQTAEMLRDTHNANLSAELVRTKDNQKSLILDEAEIAKARLEEAREKEEQSQNAALQKKLAEKRAKKAAQAGTPPPSSSPEAAINPELEKAKQKEQEQQSAEHAQRLAEKRAKRAGGSPQAEGLAKGSGAEDDNDGQGSSFTTLQKFMTLVSGWSGLDLVDKHSSTLMRILNETAESGFAWFTAAHAGLLTESVSYELQITNVASFMAQIYRSQSEGDESCYQSHIALARLLPAILSKTLTETDLSPNPLGEVDADTLSADQSVSGALVERRDWCRACLNLVEYYLMQNDISHAELCLDAIRAASSLPADLNFGGPLPALTLSTFHHACPLLEKDERLRYQFYLASLYYRYLKSMGIAWSTFAEEGATSLDGVSIPLFLNPDFPPEETRNQPTRDTGTPGHATDPATGKRIANWSRAERTPFDGVTQVKISAPKMQYQVTRTLEELQFFDEMLSAGLDLLASPTFGVSLHSECEMHLQSLRMRASADEVLYAFSDDIRYAKRRIETLTSILNSELNPVGFRNVIQQALFDCGVSAQSISENEDVSEADRKLYQTKTLDFFQKFNSNFKEELEKATKVNHQDAIFDPSDLPAFAVGLMREAYISLKLGNPKGSIEVYAYTIDLLRNKYPTALSDYPELQTQLSQCEELCELLKTQTPGSTATTKARVNRNAKFNTAARGAGGKTTASVKARVKK